MTQRMTSWPEVMAYVQWTPGGKAHEVYIEDRVQLPNVVETSGGRKVAGFARISRGRWKGRWIIMETPWREGRIEGVTT